MTRENRVQILGNAARVDQCPAGKLALHTNIDSNDGSGAGGTRDILTTPNRQLEIKLLESCGFIVSQYEGVSGVVNKMSQPHWWLELTSTGIRYGLTQVKKFLPLLIINGLPVQRGMARLIAPLPVYPRPVGRLLTISFNLKILMMP